jgi:hypothetical protein
MVTQHQVLTLSPDVSFERAQQLVERHFNVLLAGNKISDKPQRWAVLFTTVDESSTFIGKAILCLLEKGCSIESPEEVDPPVEETVTLNPIPEFTWPSKPSERSAGERSEAAVKLLFQVGTATRWAGEVGARYPIEFDVSGVRVGIEPHHLTYFMEGCTFYLPRTIADITDAVGAIKKLKLLGWKEE